MQVAAQLTIGTTQTALARQVAQSLFKFNDAAIKGFESKLETHLYSHTGIISHLVSTSWVRGHNDNSPAPYLGALPP